MNAETKLSSRGQVVIPKDVRDALAWDSGKSLSVTRSGDAVILRAVKPDRPKISHEEFRRLMPKYDGPRISIEDMNSGIEKMFRTAKI